MPLLDAICRLCTACFGLLRCKGLIGFVSDRSISLQACELARLASLLPESYSLASIYTLAFFFDISESGHAADFRCIGVV